MPETTQPLACSLSATDRADRTTEIAALRRALVSITSESSSATLVFRGRDARTAVDRFVATESACCPFFEIAVDQQADELRMSISTPPGGEAILADLVAEISRSETPQKAGKDARRAAGIGAIVGISCLACLLPGIIAGGAIVGGTALLAEVREMAALALIAGGSVLALLWFRRRRATTSCGC